MHNIITKLILNQDQQLLMLRILFLVVAVNIAVALAKEFKLKVGLLDADIYGPSIPTMMHLDEKPEVSEGITISSTSLTMCHKVHVNMFPP
jgi:hypothetical protein